MEIINVKNLKKNFGSLEVLKDINFTVEKGDVIAALGPSGSGKSTLLRTLIDLEKADGGDIVIEGQYLCRNGVYPNEKSVRKICAKMGMVFQHFNLFPHMTVGENLMCAPKLLKQNSNEEIFELCCEMLEKVGLLEKIDERPSNLSGGQKQRVAIARALMLKPDIILFDEPTSALDPELTKEVLNVIRALADERMTMIIVTHEIGFAREAAGKILFMDGGYVLAEGSPCDVLDNSGNERIDSFLNVVL